jgi:ligand-binding sensor domain-containing protein
MKEKLSFYNSLILMVLDISLASCCLTPQANGATPALLQTKTVDSSYSSEGFSTTASLDSPLRKTPNLRETSDVLILKQREDWTEYRIAADLTKSEIYMIAEAPDGNMWFGGSNGLVEFNEKDWIVHLSKASLHGRELSALAISSENKIWVGTERNGIMAYDGKEWKTYSSEDGLINNEVYALAVDPRGNVWVGSHVGELSMFDGKRWSSYQYDNSRNEHVRDLAIDEDGNVWFGTEKGIMRFGVNGWKEYGLGSGASAFSLSPDGTIWVGTVKSGVVHIDVDQDHVYQDPVFKDFSPDGIIITSTNDVWVSSWGGYQLARLDGEKWTSLSGKKFADLESDFSPQVLKTVVFTTYKDKKDGIWFGTPIGVFRYCGLSRQSCGSRIPE